MSHPVELPELLCQLAWTVLDRADIPDTPELLSSVIGDMLNLPDGRSTVGSF